MPVSQVFFSLFVGRSYAQLGIPMEKPSSPSIKEAPKLITSISGFRYQRLDGRVTQSIRCRTQSGATVVEDL